MSEPNFQKTLIEELVLFFEPLVQGAATPEEAYAQIASLGWNATALFGPPPNPVINAWTAAAAAVGAIEQALTPPPESIGDLLKALGAVKDVADAIAALSTAFGSGQPAELGTLVPDLLGMLVLQYLGRKSPVVVDVLRLLTIVRPEDRTAVVKSSKLLREPATLERLELDRIPLLFSDPIQTLRDYYLPGGLATNDDATLAASRILPAAATLLSYTGAATVVGRGASEPYLDDDTEQALLRMLTAAWTLTGEDGLTADLGLTARILSGQEQGPGVSLAPFGSGELELALGAWRFAFSLAASAGVLVIKSGGLEADVGDASLNTSVTVGRTSSDGAPLRLGSATGTRLEAGLLAFTVEGGFQHAAGGSDKVEYGLSALIQQAALVIAAGDGDGFLQKVLPPDGFRIAFDFGIGWSNTQGLYFHGSAGLDVELTLDIDLFGVLKINSVFISLHIKADGGPPGIQTALAITLSLKMGPFAAVVERFGLKANLDFPPAGGNAGPAELDFGFKPPNGVGMSLSSGPVRGGGYLFIDADAGQYAGVLELAFSAIAIKAIGLLNTKMPDGSPGFSLIIIITVEFTPIQLGYGFTLDGVGGLIGVNREMLLDPLRNGIKNHTVDSILFPSDPVANAARIISDLKAIFPPTEGRFAFGLMAKLGWGSDLITAELGIIIVLMEPIRLAILGKIQLVLPEADDEAVVKLHLDVLGTLDFDKGELGIDAVLYDSQIAIFNIGGGMALRLSWGANPAFAMAVGGFNPRFPVPAGFPILDRLALSLATSDNPRIRLETYLAVTSNTVQIGAKIDVFAQFSLLGTWTVEAYLGFDALCYLSPFHFQVDVTGGASLKHDGHPFLNVDLLLSISGPGHWIVHGHAVFDFFGRHTVEIDKTIGDPDPPAPMPVVNPLDGLKTALEDPRSWSAQMPDSGQMLVSLRQIDAPGLVLVHPLGQVEVRERLVPLEVTITHFGASDPGPTRLLKIESVRIGTQTDAVAAGNVAGATQLREPFAPGQFFALTEDQKLSGPEFEALPAGLSGIGSTQTAWGVGVDAIFDYETIVIDAIQAAPAKAEGKYSPRGQVVQALANASASAHSPARLDGAGAFRAPSLGISVSRPAYRIVTKQGLSNAPGTGQYASRTEAVAALGSAAGEGLQVVGTHEVTS